MIQVFVVTLLAACASAGLLPAPVAVTKYSSAPAVSYAYQSAPVPVHATAPVQYAPAPVHYAPAPVHYAPAPVVHKYTAPVVHAAPVAHYAPQAVYHSAPVAHVAPVAKAIVHEPYAPPHYEFSYSVSDPHTGDSKSQHESRVNDVVHGSYSLIDSDGFKRTVDYTADDHNGFNAVVHREPVGKVIAHAPAAYAAPVAKVVAQPIVYAAPVAKYFH